MKGILHVTDDTAADGRTPTTNHRVDATVNGERTTVCIFEPA